MGWRRRPAAWEKLTEFKLALQPPGCSPYILISLPFSNRN
jgi:hypothetical protein